MCMIAGSATVVETLKSALAEAEEAKASKAAADKARADLKAEQVARHECEERVTEVERELKDAPTSASPWKRKIKRRGPNLPRPFKTLRRRGPNPAQRARKFIKPVR